MGAIDSPLGRGDKSLEEGGISKFSGFRGFIQIYLKDIQIMIFGIFSTKCELKEKANNLSRYYQVGMGKVCSN